MPYLKSNQTRRRSTINISASQSRQAARIMASPSTPLLSDQAPSSNPSNSHSQQNSSSNLNHDSENVSLRQRLESLNQLALEHWQSLSSRTKVIYVFLWLFYITLGIGFWVIGPERVFDCKYQSLRAERVLVVEGESSKGAD